MSPEEKSSAREIQKKRSIRVKEVLERVAPPLDVKDLTPIKITMSG